MTRVLMVRSFPFLMRAMPASSRLQGTVADVENLSQEQGHFAKTEVPFARAKVGPFLQEPPQLGNQYKEDATLQAYLRRHMPQQVFAEVEPDLTQFGQRTATDIYDLHLQCDRELPRVQHFDAWGQRVDNLITGEAWRKMHDLSAQEGLIAIAYERKHGEWSRLYQMSKLLLYNASAGLYSCPLAMTDGAAKICEILQNEHPWLMKRAYPHLTSRKPEEFWTSGQWMTEKRGGSDVANGTETLAIPQADGSYRLHGYKWFSSATDSDVTFTLARVLDEEGNTVQGTRGLALFYLEVRGEDGKLNNIQIHNLKNKLGTKQVPTAELLLDGTVAYKISEDGRGVPGIATMLKLTRLHNAVSATAGMRKMVNLARDYSTRRSAFGNILRKYPLHVQTLSRLEVEVRGATLLSLELARLLGREDVGVATDHEQHLMRLVVPLAKLYTAKQALEVSTEGLESFGGQGYIEDTGLPGMLRDAQVLSIWEGTTNVLSLDVLRAVAKSKGQVLKVLYTEIQEKLKLAKSGELMSAASKVQQAADGIMMFVGQNSNSLEVTARDLSLSLCRTYMGSLLIDHSCSSVGTPQDVYTAVRWCEKDLAPVLTNHKAGHYSKENLDRNFSLLFDHYHDKSRL